MRSFLLLLLLFAIFSLSAQADRHERYDYQRFGQASPGETLFCLGNNLNVRAEPDAAATVTGTLPVGSQVTVKNISEKHFVQRGFSAPWYEVEYTLGGQTASGFMWSGMLTHIRVKSATTDGLYFLMGPALFTPDKEDPSFGRFGVQVRAVLNGAEAGKVEFDAIGQPGHIFAGITVGDQGIAGTKELLLLNSSGESCGVAGGESLVVWNGKALFYAGKTKTVVDAPVFFEEAWVFPRESGGQAGCIVWTMKQGEYIEGENGESQERLDAQSQKRFVWNGTKLVKK